MAARHGTANGSLKLAADIKSARERNGEGRVAEHAADLAAQLAPHEAAKPATRTMIRTLAALMVQQEDAQALILKQGIVVRGKPNPALAIQTALTAQIGSLWVKLRLVPTTDKRIQQGQAAAARGLVPGSSPNAGNGTQLASVAELAEVSRRVMAARKEK